MRAAFGGKPGTVELRDVPIPAPRGGEVLVKVRNCGICGSDLHWFHGRFPVPLICPGHEISGEIVAVGAEVTGPRVGDAVAIEPLVVCGECEYCRTGNYQLCRRIEILGVTRPGGFAEYVVAPANTVYRLPTEVDYTTGTLTEPMAVCVHALRMANLLSGHRVLVLGGGTIGLLSVLAARLAGAADVTITTRHRTQADMGRRLGAARVFSATPAGETERAVFASDVPIDVVVETVGGSADTLRAAVESVRPGGTVVVLGIFTTPQVIPALDVVSKEVRLVGSVTYGCAGRRADFEIALGILATESRTVRQLVTHSQPLEAIQEAFETAANKGRGALKVTVRSE